MKVSDFGVDHSIFSVFRLDLHGKNRVTSWTCLVVACGTDMPAFGSFFQDIEGFLTFENGLLGDSLNINTFFDVLSDLEIAVVFGVEQIDNLFIINFQKWALNNILRGSLLNFQIYGLEKVL